MRRAILFVVLASLLYVPTAGADHVSGGTYTGCLDTAGKGRGSIKKIQAGEDPIGDACPANGYTEVHITGELPDGCSGNDVAKNDGMGSWFCGEDSVGGSHDIAFRAVRSGMVPPWVASTGTTQVAFNNEDFDPAGAFAASTFTAPQAGIYHFEGRVDLTPGSGTVSGAFAKNGGEACRGSQNPVDGVSTYGIVVTCTIALVPMDTVTMTVTISAVTAQLTNGGSVQYFSGFLVS